MTYEQEVEGLLKDKSLLHLIAGLAAEAGEVCGVVQKSVYKNQPVNRDDMRSELGDVLFYATALINHFGWNVEDVQKENVQKLYRRQGK